MIQFRSADWSHVSLVMVKEWSCGIEDILQEATWRGDSHPLYSANHVSKNAST